MLINSYFELDGFYCLKHYYEIIANFNRNVIKNFHAEIEFTFCEQLYKKNKGFKNVDLLRITV